MFDLCLTQQKSRFKWSGWNPCPGRELNPHSHCCKQDFKSCVSTNSPTRADHKQKIPNTEVWNFCLERKTRFEPATLTLARWCSTSWATSACCFKNFGSAKIGAQNEKTNTFMYIFFRNGLLTINALNKSPCFSWILYMVYTFAQICHRESLLHWYTKTWCWNGVRNTRFMAYSFM